MWGYLGALAIGLLLGTSLPAVAPALELLVWPALGMLLFVTFTQVPVGDLPAAFRDTRFMAGVLVGNFVLVPLFVSALVTFAPEDPAVRLGMLVVLLVPCTDWFITFTHLAGGDTRRAVAITPVNLGVQLVLLPGYLWLLLGEAVIEPLSTDRALLTFASLILGPLLVAWGVQRWANVRPHRRRTVIERLGRLPVPLVALVVLLVAASQVTVVLDTLGLVPRVAALYLAYLLGAALIGRAIGAALRLSAASTRATIFSLGTRNSFVVLPLVLALPDGWRAAVVVVVLQSLVELLGMIAYLAIIPRIATDRRRGHR